MEFIIVADESQNAVKVPFICFHAIDITNARSVNKVDCNIIHLKLVFFRALGSGFPNHQLLVVIRVSYKYLLFHVLIHEHEL